MGQRSGPGHEREAKDQGNGFRQCGRSKDSGNRESLQSQVAKSTDGKVWFWTGDGVSLVDPNRLPLNNIQPPMQVEQLVADRQAYEATTGSGPLRLPPLIRDLQIDYTALSLVAPEKNRFRY